MRTREEVEGSVIDEEQRYRLVGSCHLPQRGLRRLGRGLAPHGEVVAEPPGKIEEQHIERVRVTIDHEKHR